MKKMFMMLITLFALYFGIQYAFRFIGNGHHEEYNLKINDISFNINETLTINKKNEDDNYYFEIKFNNQIINFQLYDLMNRGERVIEDIKYYQDDKYSCILPIFENNQVKTDIMCLDKKIIYNYHTIMNKNSKLDNWVKTIEQYNIETRSDNKKNPAINGILTAYYDNIQENHYVAFSDYKGLILTNKTIPSKFKTIKLFDKDVYNREIEFIINNKYITADYAQQYQFNRFLVVDIVTGDVKKIDTPTSISFDSYIQGVVNEELYLIDTDNKIQYKLNLEKLTISEIGSEQHGAKHFNNGVWETTNINQLIKNKTIFISDEPVDYIDNTYEKIDKQGNVYSGYYYLYKKNGNKYDLYRANVQNTDVKNYLFSTTNLNSVIYVENNIYYLNGTEIKCYNDEFGIKTIMQSDELKYNKNLFYYVYYKD